jgi:hypothetical protein
MDPNELIKAAPLLTKGAAAIGAALLFMAFAQSADITGWQGLPWGTSKAVALKTLQSLHVHECRRAVPCAEELIIDDYRLNGVSYEIDLAFLPRYGLGRVTMTAEDERDAFRNVLADLTRRHGKPGLQSSYDGAQEAIRANWIWITPHGKLSLASEDGEGTNGLFTIIYEARRASQ